MFSVLWSAPNQRCPELLVLLQKQTLNWTKTLILNTRLSFFGLLLKVQGYSIYFYLLSWRMKKTPYTVSALNWIKKAADFFLSFFFFTKIAAIFLDKKNYPPSNQKHLFKYIFSRPTKRLTSWHCLRVAFLLQQMNCHHACTTTDITGVSWSFQQAQAIVVRLKRCCQQHCFLLSHLFLSTYFYLKCQKYLNIKT